MNGFRHWQARRDLARHFGDQLGPRGERRLRRHLARCRACQLLHSAYCVAEGVGASATRRRYERIRLGVFGPTEQPVRSRLGLGLKLAAATAVVTIALLVISPHLQTDRAVDGLREKGSESISAAQQVSVALFAADDHGKLARVRTSLVRGRAVAIAYSNWATQGYDRLMVFAVDDTYAVYWYYPAWTDSRRNPEPVAVRGGRGIELPDAVTHDYRGSRLWVFALFTKRRDLRVQHIEAIVRRWKRTGVALEGIQRFPLPRTEQHLLRIELKGRRP